MADLESLKRVLTELKGEARKLRQEQLGSRLSPKSAKEEPAKPDAETEEPAVEVSVEEPTDETEPAADAEAEAKPEDGGGTDEDTKRILRKFGI